MITVTFQIAGKFEVVEVYVIPRVSEIVKIWGNRYEVQDVIHDISESIIWISLYPNEG